jgi:8-oxo-dGTP diphosphatase
MNRDIHKSAGIIIKNRKILVEKDIDKEFFISPGGKLEEGETSKQALVRELNEELKIVVEEKNLEKFGHFDAPASGQEERIVHMDVFVVKSFKGKIQKGHKVEKLLWINSNTPKKAKIGSIFEHEVIPRLKTLQLID